MNFTVVDVRFFSMKIKNTEHSTKKKWVTYQILNDTLETWHKKKRPKQHETEKCDYIFDILPYDSYIKRVTLTHEIKLLSYTPLFKLHT